MKTMGDHRQNQNGSSPALLPQRAVWLAGRVVVGTLPTSINGSRKYSRGPRQGTAAANKEEKEVILCSCRRFCLPHEPEGCLRVFKDLNDLAWLSPALPLKPTSSSHNLTSNANFLHGM